MPGIDTQIDGPESKRRKVRKGTQSCWECKRRKVRCIFSRISPADAVCDNCTRRGTACVGQEQPDEPTFVSNSNHLESRLGRVEVLLERLANDAIPTRNSILSADALIGDYLDDSEHGVLEDETSKDGARSPTRVVSELRAGGCNPEVSIFRLQALPVFLF